MITTIPAATRDEDGRTRLTSSYDLTTAGYLGGGTLGALWGLIFGAIASNPAAGVLAGAIGGATGGSLWGALNEVGAQDTFVGNIGDRLKPDSSALAMLAWTDPQRCLKRLRV